VQGFTRLHIVNYPNELAGVRNTHLIYFQYDVAALDSLRFRQASRFRTNDEHADLMPSRDAISEGTSWICKPIRPLPSSLASSFAPPTQLWVAKNSCKRTCDFKTSDRRNDDLNMPICQST
jgi:hypothetical protein